MAESYTIRGNRGTLGSILHEIQHWLAGLPGPIDFVNPEVRMIAQAAARSGIWVGYEVPPYRLRKRG